MSALPSLYTCISFICWIMSGLATGFCWAIWPQTIDFALSSIVSSLGYLRARLGLPLHVSQASGFTPSSTAAKRETELAGLPDHKCLCRRMACASLFPGRQTAAGWWGWRWGWRWESTVIILVQNVHAQLDPCFFPPKHVWLFHHRVIAHPKGPHSSGIICAYCWGRTSVLLLLNWLAAKDIQF